MGVAGVPRPLVGGVHHATGRLNACEVGTALREALEQPPALLGLEPGSPLLLTAKSALKDAKTALTAHRRARLGRRERAGGGAPAGAPAMSPPVGHTPHTLLGRPPTPPQPPRHLP